MLTSEQTVMVHCIMHHAVGPYQCTHWGMYTSLAIISMSLGRSFSQVTRNYGDILVARIFVGFPEV